MVLKIEKLVLDGKDQDNLLCLIEIIRQSNESREKVLKFVDYLESRIVNNDVDEFTKLKRQVRDLLNKLVDGDSRVLSIIGVILQNTDDPEMINRIEVALDAELL